MTSRTVKFGFHPRESRRSRFGDPGVLLSTFTTPSFQPPSVISSVLVTNVRSHSLNAASVPAVVSLVLDYSPDELLEVGTRIVNAGAARGRSSGIYTVQPATSVCGIDGGNKSTVDSTTAWKEMTLTSFV